MPPCVYLALPQLTLLKEVFDLFDADGKRLMTFVMPLVHTVMAQLSLTQLNCTGKGMITMDELFEIMSVMGGNPTDQQLQEAMYELDANNDGSIDFPEFMTKFMVCWQQRIVRTQS